MIRLLSLVALLVATGAHAAPQPQDDDDMGRFLAEKRLVDRLDAVRTRVGERVTAGASRVSEGASRVADRVSEGASHVADRASDLVVTAMGFLGVPYRRGGNSAATGFDCSGFVKAMYEQAAGLVLPRLAKEQAAATEKIDKSQLQPGDLVFFNTLKRAFSHVGIYIGDNKFIHSPRPGARVRVEDMDVPYWKARFDGARRVLTPEPEPPQAQAQPAAAPGVQ